MIKCLINYLVFITTCLFVELYHFNGVYHVGISLHLHDVLLLLLVMIICLNISISRHIGNNGLKYIVIMIYLLSFLTYIFIAPITIEPIDEISHLTMRYYEIKPYFRWLHYLANLIHSVF